MDVDIWLLIAISIVGLVAIIGFFVTKTKGFGRIATSTFLLILVVVVSAMLFASGKLEAHVVANIFFAVIGFAGGLFIVQHLASPDPRALRPSGQVSLALCIS